MAYPKFHGTNADQPVPLSIVLNPTSAKKSKLNKVGKKERKMTEEKPRCNFETVPRLDNFDVISALTNASTGPSFGQV